jgi:hypothetical protein
LQSGNELLYCKYIMAGAAQLQVAQERLGAMPAIVDTPSSRQEVVRVLAALSGTELTLELPLAADLRSEGMRETRVDIAANAGGSVDRAVTRVFRGPDLSRMSAEHKLLTSVCLARTKYPSVGSNHWLSERLRHSHLLVNKMAFRDSFTAVTWGRLVVDRLAEDEISITDGNLRLLPLGFNSLVAEYKKSERLIEVQASQQI